MRNVIEFEVYGKYGLFTDPLTKLGGEKLSYPVPSYSALKGIAESIYWKPSIRIIVDRVRIMNPIEMESKGVRPLKYTGGNFLCYYTYIREPRYRVRAYFESNPYRPDLAADYNEGKHYAIMKRSLLAGGRRDIFLGTRECQGYVEPCCFDDGEGFYNNSGEQSFGTMVHGLNYPDETGRNKLEVRLWNPIMKDGVIEFIRPEQCTNIRTIRSMKAKHFDFNNIETVDVLLQQIEQG